MKNEVLKVLLLTLTSVSLVVGMVNISQASSELDNVQAKETIVAQDELRGFEDHPVHLGAEEKIFSVQIEPAEGAEDMAAIYEKDGGCE
jgi:hypothetical protein